jgi:predicted nucleotidyltransferase
MPTALELTREGWSSYIEKVSQRPDTSELTLEEQRERKQLLQKIREAADMLKTRFAVKRVILFGSLAHESWFISGSDVDLATEGLRIEYYWEAWRSVEEIIRDRQVDFIGIEDAGESLKRAIDRTGVEL